VDFAAMYYSLLKTGYCGFLTAELYPYSAEPEKAAKETIVCLKKLVN